MLLKQSSTRNRPIFLVASSDHISGLTSATLTITASKDGAAFGSITPTVTERGNGWYTLALTGTHTDTLGAFALHVTATGADPTDLADEVVVDLPGATITSVTTVSDKTGYRLSSTGVADILTTALTESYAADGATPTLSQFLYMLWAAAAAEKSITGTTMTVKKLDGSTTAMTFTLNSSTAPTSITRAT